MKGARSREMEMRMWVVGMLVLVLSVGAYGQTEIEVKALKSFKLSADIRGNLKDWTGSNPCSKKGWSGVVCQNGRVISLVLENMGLGGSISVLSSLDQLRLLSLKGNSLNGSIPDFSNWRFFKLVYLNNNQFSGPIPESVGSPAKLARLNLQNNKLNGPIPASLNNLKHLQTLRLENNRLVGIIPSISLPSLTDFNVSGNQLSGAVPATLGSVFGQSAFLGNGQLCGTPLPACVLSSAPAPVPSGPMPGSTSSPPGRSRSPRSFPSPAPTVSAHKKSSRLSTREIVAIVVGDVAALLLIILAFLLFYWRKYLRRLQEKPIKGGESEKGDFSSNQYSSQLPDAERSKLVFLEGSRQTFELEDLLRASAEMLGKGSFGTAYKAVLEDGSLVAVKRLKDVSTNGRKEFEQQMELIGKLKHPNVVSLRAYYYAKGEKLLVYDYQLNGSLYSLLHGNRGPGRTPLDWVTRLRIALGAARGLAYLHQECGSQKIPHGNIKSSNILLDKSYNACISDYGLALLMTSSAATIRMTGYRAPEHADTKRISQRADVYSFGVVLLELLTGKAPVPAYSNAASDEGVDLPKWVHSVVREEWTAEVFDIELMRYRNIEEEMVALLQIAMVCVSPSPEQRPKMGQVVKMIQDIRPVQTPPDDEGIDSQLQSPLSESG